ncbi:MAG: hypothetical protein HYW45_01060 [Candidatus Daviesbacteria bacterium]|nr:MAG: hypothetical protein HYW45_01060 [Candidatus Daviesbacteria bacterium]
MKIITYPVASFVNALDLAKTVDSLGDNCAHTTCATKMGKKMSGGFKDIIASAVKYGMIKNKGGILSLTSAFKEYKLSYTPEEGKEHLIKLFLSPQLFQEIYAKYNSVGLPSPDVLEKALVREFGVPDKFATRTSTYFLNGAKYVGLLGEHNNFTSKTQPTTDVTSEQKEGTDMPHTPGLPQHESKPNDYSVQIVGPGIDTKLILTEESDFLILNAILNKVKSKLTPEKKGKIKDENPQSPA